MREQAEAFREESEALYALLSPLQDADWEQPTQFKAWTLNDVVAHLHAGNHSADLSLNDAAAHAEMKSEWKRIAEAEGGLTNLQMTHRWLAGLRGPALLAAWRSAAHALADDFAVADPKKRVPWAGREMSAISSISARLMETWAHGQELYDQLGVQRTNTDRIRNIVTLGINTFGWTFTNRGDKPPAARPRVSLTAPSGATWTWEAQPIDQADPTNFIEGSAIEFCQVVTQVRNVADTRLRVEGDTAKLWMSLAQCFAGPPRMPPAPGTRFMRRV